MFEWMKTANGYGVWGFTNTVVLLGSLGLAIQLIFFPAKRIPHLNFQLRRERTTGSHPLRINIEIRNYTGQPCVIAFPFATLDKLRPDPTASGDSASRQLEVKFGSTNGAPLTQIDFFIRHGETASTWIPLDPTHTDAEVDAALDNGAVGHFECTLNWLGDNPKRQTLRFRLRK